MYRSGLWNIQRTPRFRRHFILLCRKWKDKIHQCLHLNAGTRFTYPSSFQGSERRVFIEGEVFAEVAKNPEQPFIIASGDVDVKVLGTTKTGEARNTIPDAITSDTVYEVKDVQTLNNTKQIQAQINYAKEKGLDYKIIIGTNTHFSRNIPDEYIIRLEYIGPQK